MADSEFKWTIDNYGCYWTGCPALGVRIWMAPRPEYCDRGAWLAHVETSDPRLCFIDESDLWPRYYFDLDRAKLECEEFLTKRLAQARQRGKVR